MKAEKLFVSEADLCRNFSEWAEEEGWECWPEVCGFDIMAVNRETNLQCGIQAKLKLNAKVIEQIIPGNYYNYGRDTGPNHLAILIPRDQRHSGFAKLLDVIGINIIAVGINTSTRRDVRVEGFPDRRGLTGMLRPLFDWNPKDQCKLPEYRSNLPAGMPSPVQLSHWKVGALKVLAILQRDGIISRQEIAKCGVDPRRFCNGTWLESADKPGIWKAGPMLPKFNEQHPETFEQIKIDIGPRIIL